MLTKLTVRNYALIKELDLEFDSGLTIITGETGSGKTILLGALSLILGNRADTSVLLEPGSKCVVEGTFKLDMYDLQDFFTDNDLDFDPVTIIRREINPAGKSRAFINDTPVTVSLLKELGTRLIDIHSQHQSLMLNENSFQLSIIDSFAGTSELLKEYREAYTGFRTLQKELSELRSKEDRNKADLEYYQYQLDQLEEAKLKEHEQEELEREQEILDHAEEIAGALGRSSALLLSDEISVLSMLKEIKSNIDRIVEFLPEAAELTSRFDSTYIELGDLTNEIEKLSERIEADPQRLVYINDRLSHIYSLLQKHRVQSLEGLLMRKEEIKNIISSIGASDIRLNQIEGELEEKQEILSILAMKISSMRKEVLPGIEDTIKDLLFQLGIPNARFMIKPTQTADFTASGIDNVDFLFSANKQMHPEELSRIASGGELSRVMLSLKSLIAKNINLPTIIFDEIDSGVSGEVADRVGQILSSMGRRMQVVNITHLPQVASRGTRHFHIFKEDTDDSTITRVKLLSDTERIIEVARLLSGSEISDVAIENAKELLKSAAS